MAQQRPSGIRRGLRRAIRNCYDWLDVLVTVALFAVSMSALMRWPDKFPADIAIPTAFLIAFMLWRER
jgi:hypothetical protein